MYRHYQDSFVCIFFSGILVHGLAFRYLPIDQSVYKFRSTVCHESADGKVLSASGYVFTFHICFFRLLLKSTLKLLNVGCDWMITSFATLIALFFIQYYWFKSELDRRNTRCNVWPNSGSNPWPLNHDRNTSCYWDNLDHWPTVTSPT